MIKIFNATDKNYASNGDIVITATRARVFNADNGDFYVELTCGTEYNDYIQPNNIIVLPTPQGDQAFRIREIQKSKKRLEVKAMHVFYDGDNYLIADSYAVNMTCAQALQHFNAATDSTSPFSTFSDVAAVKSFRCVRKSLTECVATVLERWGGHLKRDNWHFEILQAPGVDNGITIEYRKNLEELTASYNWSDVVTKLLPVGKDGILLTERYVYSAVQYDIPYTKAVSFEQDINADDYPTEAAYKTALRTDLKKQAQAYVDRYCYPNVNYTLKGIPEKVTDIGDIIRVKDKRIGVDILTEVISYEYDALQGRYISLEFGNFTNTLSNLLVNISKETTSTVNMAVSEITTETSRIYELLQNGNVVYRGYDLLILDSLPAADAVNVLRIDGEGVAISANGVGGPFVYIYDLSHKEIKVNGQNVINIYDGADVIGTIDSTGITISSDGLKIGADTIADLLAEKQNALTAGDGIDITDDEISLARYAADAMIINATLSGACLVDSGSLSFEIDIDRPAAAVSIYNLSVTIYDGNPTTAAIVTDGTTEAGLTVTVSAVTTTKYKITITPLSIADGGYVIKYALQLKAAAV